MINNSISSLLVWFSKFIEDHKDTNSALFYARNSKLIHTKSSRTKT